LGVLDIDTTVDGFELPLEGPSHEAGDGKLTLEIRDFGSPERTLVVRYKVGANVYTAMVSWEKFVAESDAMRARLLGDDWDSALANLTGRYNT
jgi:hypothetical protein